jgi:hypothetical protein
MENKQMEIKSLKRAERTTELIANFIEGFADGWHMALKESFKIELDIKFSERKKDKVSFYEWTQGPYYCFSEGQTIYDVKDGYTCWQEALKKVSIVCQVIAARPNIPFKYYNEVTDKNEIRVLDGYVRFVLFKPDKERTKLDTCICYHLTQNEFVNFLKTGEL